MGLRSLGSSKLRAEGFQLLGSTKLTGVASAFKISSEDLKLRHGETCRQSSREQLLSWPKERRRGTSAPGAPKTSNRTPRLFRDARIRKVIPKPNWRGTTISPN